MHQPGSYPRGGVTSLFPPCTCTIPTLRSCSLLFVHNFDFPPLWHLLHLQLIYFLPSPLPSELDSDTVTPSPWFQRLRFSSDTFTSFATSGLEVLPELRPLVASRYSQKLTWIYPVNTWSFLHLRNRAVAAETPQYLRRFEMYATRAGGVM